MRKIVIYGQCFAMVGYLGGCSVTRPVERMKAREEFFSPVKARQERAIVPESTRETTTSQTKIPKVNTPYTPSMKQQAILQDSLLRVNYVTQELLDRISKLEENQYMAYVRETALEKQLSYVQEENRRLSQQLSEVRAQLYASRSEEMPKAISPAVQPTGMQTEYEGALSLFAEKNYGEAIKTFKGLISNGIEEDLADNCEYWIGESYFARNKFRMAIASFEKVIMMPTSNKKADAYLMMGRSYEKVHYVAKARWAYEELMTHFPDSEHARLAKAKLKKLQPKLIQKKSIHSSTT